MRSLRSSVFPLGWPIVLVSALTGCPDPEQKFNDFQAVADPYFAQFGGSICPSAPPVDADGQYLFSLAPDPESPEVPAPFLADVTVTAEGLSFTLQPLTAADRMTQVGMPQSFGPFPIDANGRFEITLTDVNVPPETNPLTGSQLVGTFALPGGFCTDDNTVFCGTFEGELSVPTTLPLSGTWAFQKLDNGTIVEPPVVGCDGKMAAPL